MENILFFLESCKKIQVNPKAELFQPLDLFEMKNISKVMDVLVAFAEAASKKLPENLAFNSTFAEQLVFSELELNNVADQLELDSNMDNPYIHGEEYWEETENLNIEEEEVLNELKAAFDNAVDEEDETALVLLTTIKTAYFLEPRIGK